MSSIRTPKLTSGRGLSWYRYYAGFSPDFVADICDRCNLSSGHRVLDPWMGSGTTLSVAARRHYYVDGLDLNPVMTVVAKGRLIADDTQSSIEPLLTEVTKYWRAVDVCIDDMLTHWFSLETVSLLRGLARRINTVLVSQHFDVVRNVQNMSSLAALFYVGLFETITSHLKSFTSQNPTWIKKGTRGAGSITLSKRDIRFAFEQSIQAKLSYLNSNGTISTEVRDLSTTLVGDSRSLPFEDSTCDAVITSPPYLTRLDYVVAHLPELALLGFDEAAIRELRQRMIGTPTIQKGAEQSLQLGSRAEQIVRAVRDHGSYAANTYYGPIYHQYFAGMTESMSELQRVGKPEIPVVMVVQESWFKDIRVDLASALIDMGERLGWQFVRQDDFRNIRSMSQINPKVHRLARGTRPTETVLTLRTPSHSN